MIKRTQNILSVSIAILIFIAMLSCTEKIDIKLNSTNVRCVIYGEITTDTTSHKIRITKSADYFSNKPSEPISGASLSITDGTKTFFLTESITDPGNYFTNSDVYGIPGKTYTLNVSNVDLLGDGIMETYSASSELKPVAEVDSIDTKFNSDWDIWEIGLWAKDPIETEDFYMFKAYINGVLYTDSLKNLSITEDKFFNGNNANGSSVLMIFEKDTLEVGDTIKLDICGINKDYFQFVSEAQTMASPQVPMFSGPPANVRTNFSNEAIGYFTAYSVVSYSRKVKHGRK